jgi:hypothetical protein
LAAFFHVVERKRAGTADQAVDRQRPSGGVDPGNAEMTEDEEIFRSGYRIGHLVGSELDLPDSLGGIHRGSGWAARAALAFAFDTLGHALALPSGSTPVVR